MGQRDLTKGAVFPTMCVFALPMILGNLLQQCYNIVDSWVVGRYVSSAALGAVGSAFALMTFLTSVLLGLCMGSGVVFSLCFGTRDEPRLEDGLRASCVLTAAVTALLTAVSLLGVDAIVVWMNIPVEITEMTRDYLVLVFWGIPAIALYNFFAAYLKALGNSVVPLAFLGVSTGLNIALDLLLVAVYPFGASGAAAATVIAQYVSGLGIGLYTLARDRRLRQSLRRFRIRAASLREIASYSLLTCMQQSVMNLGILMHRGHGGLCRRRKDRRLRLYAGAGVRKRLLHLHRPEHGGQTAGAHPAGRPLRCADRGELLRRRVADSVVFGKAADFHLHRPG